MEKTYKLKNIENILLIGEIYLVPQKNVLIFLSINSLFKLIYMLSAIPIKTQTVKLHGTWLKVDSKNNIKIKAKCLKK